MKRKKKILYWFFSPLHLWTNTALQVDIKRALKVRARPRLQACSNPQALTSPAPRCAALRRVHTAAAADALPARSHTDTQASHTSQVHGDTFA